MKTLGFTSPRVFRMVLAESLLLALIGGTLGLFAANLLVNVVNDLPIQLPPLILNGSIVTKAVIIMIVLGFITGILPAISAFRLNIITALGRE